MDKKTAEKIAALLLEQPGMKNATATRRPGGDDWVVQGSRMGSDSDANREFQQG